MVTLYAYQTQVLRCQNLAIRPSSLIGAGRTLSAPMGWLWRYPQSLRRSRTTQAGATRSAKTSTMGPWGCICCTSRMRISWWWRGALSNCDVCSISSVSARNFPHKYHKYEGPKDPKRLASSRTDQQKWHVLQKSQYYRTYNVYGFLFTTKLLNNRYSYLPLLVLGPPRPQSPLVLVVLLLCFPPIAYVLSLLLPFLLCTSCLLILPSIVWSAASPDLIVHIHTRTSLVSVSKGIWCFGDSAASNGLAACNHVKLALDL